MKVLNISFADSAGAAYTLSHALNKQKGIQAVNMRANDNYINYPTIGAFRNYDMETIKRMIMKTDVLVFHTAMMPFMVTFKLTKQDLVDKKKIIYFHGSDLRTYGTEIIEQADQYWGDYEILVSTPDLLELVPRGAHWMPVCRSFSELRSKYMPSKKDEKALASFGEERVKVQLGHAPTNPEIKGSNVFFRVITEVVKQYEHAEYSAIHNLPWDSCLRRMAQLDIFYDQCVLGAYGLAAVEAGAFKLPVVCPLKPGVIDAMKEITDQPPPFIQFKTEPKLVEMSLMLCMDPKGRKMFGDMAYDYCKSVHDEKPVVERFLEIVEAMP